MPKDTPHYTGHRARLKKRVYNDPSVIEDYELLELLLGYALIRQDTKPLAKKLLKQFGSIRGVFDALPAELEIIPQFGEGLSTYWKLLREIFTRYVEMPVRKKIQLCTPENVAEIAKMRLAGCPHEELWIATVDTQNRLISWERLTKGTIDSSPLYPREIIEIVLKRKASGFILIHNHPGGLAKASNVDLEITRHLEQIAQSMSLRLIDHIIVTEKNCYSIRKEGLL